jgi:acetyl esterase
MGCEGMSVRAQIAGRLIQMGARQMIKPPAALRFPELTMAATTTHRVTTEAGEVACTAYHPTTAPAGVYVNFHGGGYVIRCPEQDDALCRYLAHHTGCVVLNVDYDVAPQHPFPVAPLQAHGVAAWAANAGAEFGWDGRRLAVGGQSAGGALAAAVCRLARDRGTFTPRLQVLLYPPTDLTIPPDRKHARATKPVITPGISTIFNEAYAPDPATRTDPLVSPGVASDLAGLAPAVIITAELDTLREEADRFAAALAAAGVPVVHKVFPGVDHAFTHREPAAVAIEAYALVADRIAAALA